MKTRTQEGTIMNKNFLIKSLGQGVIGWILLALLLSFTKDMTFVQALAAPSTITMSVAAVIGCYIGYMRRAKKQAMS